MTHLWLFLRRSATSVPRRRIRAAAGIAAAGMVLVACGGGDTSPRHADGTPKPGGTLTMSLPSETTSFDPAQTSFVNVADGSRMSAVYDALLRTDPSTGTVHPQIAESFVAAADNRDWTLRIRPNVRFSDGTPFDAAAVKANWVRYQDPAKSFQALAAASITDMRVDAKEPLVLHVTLAKPNANFDRMVAANLTFIVSPKTFDNPVGLREHPVGAGPFLLKEWVPGERQVFVRNPDYWQKENGLPYLDQVEIRVDVDIRGSVDKVGSDLGLTVVVDPNDIARARTRGIATEELRLSGGSMVMFNNAVGAFSDVRARRAFAYALSGAEINQQYFNGTGTPAKGIFATNSPVANINLTAPENDPAKAAQLFAEITANGSRPFAFTYVTPPSAGALAVAKYIQGKLNAYPGVVMNLQEVDVPTYIGLVRKGSDKWDAAMAQMWIDDPEPRIYDLLYSTSQGFGGAIGYANPAVDKALDEARVNSDTPTRRALYTQVQIHTNEEMPFWVYQEAAVAALADSEVTGVELFNDGVIRWDTIGFRE